MEKGDEEGREGRREERRREEWREGVSVGEEEVRATEDEGIGV